MTALAAPPEPPRAPAPTRMAGAKVVRQLARVEARRLLIHPIIWGGIALAALMGWADLNGIRLVLPRESIYLQNPALPIAAATLLAVHLATTRPRRDDVVEVLEPAVHGEDVRIRALLLASLTPAVLTTILMGVALAAIAIMGAPGPVLWAEAAVGPVVIALTGTLGVLLGRVAPWRLTPVFALVGIVLVQFLLPEIGGPGGSSTVELFAPIIMPSFHLPDPTALLRPAVEHLAYLVGLVLVLAALAMLVTRVTVGRLAAGVVAVALVATGAITQVRPPSDAEVDAMLAGVGTPVEAGECIDGESGVQVCALPMFLDWRDDWAAVADAVREPLVQHGVDPGPLTVAQRTDPSVATFELQRWFDPAEVDDAGHIETGWEFEYFSSVGTVLVTSDWPRPTGGADRGVLGLATNVARQATGLPNSFPYVIEAAGPDADGRSCSAAGQARAPVSLWLAAQADPGAAEALRQAAVDADARGLTAIDIWSRSVTAIEPDWTLVDAEVALQMLDRPADEVAAVLAPDWGRWTDPTTSLTDLADGLGLAIPAGADPASLVPVPTPDLDADGVAVYTDEAEFDAATAIGCP